MAFTMKKHYRTFSVDGQRERTRTRKQSCDGRSSSKTQILISQQYRRWKLNFIARRNKVSRTFRLKLEWEESEKSKKKNQILLLPTLTIFLCLSIRESSAETKKFAISAIFCEKSFSFSFSPIPSSMTRSEKPQGPLAIRKCACESKKNFFFLYLFACVYFSSSSLSSHVSMYGDDPQKLCKSFSKLAREQTSLSRPKKYLIHSRSIDEHKFSHGEVANCTVNSHSFQ